MTDKQKEAIKNRYIAIRTDEEAEGARLDFLKKYASQKSLEELIKSYTSGKDLSLLDMFYQENKRPSTSAKVFHGGGYVTKTGPIFAGLGSDQTSQKTKV